MARHRRAIEPYILLEERRKMMKGVAFSDMKSFYFGNVNQSGKGSEMSNGESFLQVFDKTQSNTETVNCDSKEVKTKDAESIQNHANVQKKNTSNTIKENKEEVSMETIEETANQMKEKVAEVLDVSVEEVENVLETLGLSVVDLLNGDVLTQVVMALNPGVDALQIMMDEGLSTDLKTLMEFAQGLKNQMCEQFQLSEADLKAVMEQFKEIQQVQVSMPEAVMEEVSPEMVTLNSDVEADTDGDVEVVQSETAKTDMTVDGKPVSMETVPVEVKDDRAETSSQNGSESGQNLFKEFYQQLTQAVEQADVQTTTYGTSGQEIIHQITEYIKVHVKPETTEMELQLHPATLGSVKVQIASSGGVLSAVFTTENETVKAVLETQLVQLKENFEQQGLKVESVEVNVSAQGFDRSLDQQESEQNAYNETKEKKNNRRIRLNGLGDGEETTLEELSEEDKVVADMMIRNGNSVDYTV